MGQTVVEVEKECLEEIPHPNRKRAHRVIQPGRAQPTRYFCRRRLFSRRAVATCHESNGISVNKRFMHIPFQELKFQVDIELVEIVKEWLDPPAREGPSLRGKKQHVKTSWYGYVKMAEGHDHENPRRLSFGAKESELGIAALRTCLNLTLQGFAICSLANLPACTICGMIEN